MDLDFRDTPSETLNLSILDSLELGKYFLRTTGNPCHAAQFQSGIPRIYWGFLRVVVVVVLSLLLVMTLVVFAGGDGGAGAGDVFIVAVSGVGDDAGVFVGTVGGGGVGGGVSVGGGGGGGWKALLTVDLTGRFGLSVSLGNL